MSGSMIPVKGASGRQVGIGFLSRSDSKSSSTDGAHWTKIGTTHVPDMKDALDVGMFAFRSSAKFEDFKVER